MAVWVWASAAAWGQVPGPQEQARAAQEQAIQKQRETIEKQRAAVRVQIRSTAPTDAFFASPWTAPMTVTTPVRGPDCDPVPEGEIATLVEEIARREGLTPNLLRAVIEKESAWLPCAVSQKGAQGLMQLMPDTAADLGVGDPFDAAQNLSGGARFLRQLLDRYGGNLALALGAYNAGPRQVDQLGRLPLFPETVNYVTEILEKLRGGPTAGAPR